MNLCSLKLFDVDFYISCYRNIEGSQKMALAGLGSRKRYRSSCEDEISEFTPLSKRINNLHINNSILPLSKNQLPNDGQKVEIHRELIESNEKMTELDYEGTRNLGSGCVSQPWIGTYNPDLTPAENPYYYESNRLLFELYLERSQRNATGPQPHF